MHHDGGLATHDRLMVDKAGLAPATLALHQRIDPDLGLVEGQIRSDSRTRVGHNGVCHDGVGCVHLVTRNRHNTVPPPGQHSVLIFVHRQPSFPSARWRC
ncbi:hypothetical protein XAC2852_490013 [Xanthomonas citri pv. citri]|nr:hypothetical protein XAC2852_490013 [Xanthomonas citri pv. citri]